MIVDSMTHEEVYQELAKDRDAVTRWWKHQLIALERPMIKRKVFPANLLGQIVNGIYIARTFITYDMCSGKQQEEFESCRKQIPDDMEMYEQAKIHYV